MVDLFDMKGGKLFKVFSAVAKGLTPEIGDAICHETEGPKIVEVMFKAAQAYLDRNPYEMTVEQQLALLHQVNRRESSLNPHWTPITEEDFLHLARTAPAWPKGKHAYRSLRIRFGEGDEGVAKTFEAHVECMRRTFGEKSFARWGRLCSSSVFSEGEPVARLRLLNGNHTHKPVIEWVIVDLDVNRQRESITAVRGANSLADEILVIAWMFPSRIRAIDCDKLPALFAAGYEANIHNCCGESWRHVVLVDFGRDGRQQVGVLAYDRRHNDSACSVPVVRKPPALGA